MDKIQVPGDGVITGYGKIDGRKVYVYAQDFTSIGGTLWEIHAVKICKIMDSGVKGSCPIIGINDSGGARIQDSVDALAGYRQIFYRNSIYCGVVPQICGKDSCDDLLESIKELGVLQP